MSSTVPFERVCDGAFRTSRAGPALLRALPIRLGECDYADPGAGSTLVGMTHRHPVLFLGHGAPMNATRASPFTAALQALAPDLAGARGALFVSAHWETDGVEVLAAPRLAKI